MEQQFGNFYVKDNNIFKFNFKIKQGYNIYIDQQQMGKANYQNQQPLYIEIEVETCNQAENQSQTSSKYNFTLEKEKVMCLTIQGREIIQGGMKDYPFSSELNTKFDLQCQIQDQDYYGQVLTIPRTIFKYQVPNSVKQNSKLKVHRSEALKAYKFQHMSNKEVQNFSPIKEQSTYDNNLQVSKSKLDQFKQKTVEENVDFYQEFQDALHSVKNENLCYSQQDTINQCQLQPQLQKSDYTTLPALGLIKSIESLSLSKHTDPNKVNPMFGNNQLFQFLSSSELEQKFNEEYQIGTKEKKLQGINKPLYNLDPLKCKQGFSMFNDPMNIIDDYDLEAEGDKDKNSECQMQHTYHED